jgi:hypothetical protein
VARPMEAPMARPMVRHLAPRPIKGLKASQMARHLAHLMEEMMVCPVVLIHLTS